MEYLPQKAGSSEQKSLMDLEGREEIRATTPKLVIAKYKFEGRNNDELSFVKNDVITVTQQLEGGWWEGSLEGRVGWFPSEFVGIIKNHNNDSTQNQIRMAENGRNNESTGKSKNLVGEVNQKLEANRFAFRAGLIQELLAKEQEHSKAIEQTLDVLRMLTKMQAELSRNELLVKAIVILTEFLKLKQNLVRRFEEEARMPLEAQQIGKLFLDFAHEIRSNLRLFCERHCDLVELLNQKSDQIEKFLLPVNIDLKELVLGLSLMFRHIQKYAGILQEIERNTQENHSDRGNLQRAASFYRNFHDKCEMIRRQREAQLDFLQTILFDKNIDDDYERKFGTLLYIGKVSVIESQEKNKKLVEDNTELLELDRCIAIFSSAILLLEMQIPSGRYILKNHFASAELIAHQKESVKNSLELLKGKDLLITLRSVSKNDFSLLTDALRQSVKQFESANDADKSITTLSKIMQKNNPSPVKLRQRYVNGIETGPNQTDFWTTNPTTKATASNNSNTLSSSFGNIRLNHQLEMILPDGVSGQPQQRSSSGRISSEHSYLNGIANNSDSFITVSDKSAISKPLYFGWTLRPIPPQRGEWLPSSKYINRAQQQIKLRKGLTPEEQEDAKLLKIVEGYCFVNNLAGCTSTSIMNVKCCGHHRQRPYQQRNSADSCTSPCGGGPVRRAASYPDHNEMASRPQLIVAEDEKLFVEEMEGDEVVVKERSLVDTVYTLKDQLTALTKEVHAIEKTLEHEQRARRRMEEYLKQTEGKNISSLTTNLE